MSVFVAVVNSVHTLYSQLNHLFVTKIHHHCYQTCFDYVTVWVTEWLEDVHEARIHLARHGKERLARLITAEVDRDDKGTPHPTARTLSPPAWTPLSQTQSSSSPPTACQLGVATTSVHVTANSTSFTDPI
ncbi:hypothetical protein J6590_014549 [Homalodisca vitripennis]|nr:hypothetical protein J6590_014549 [Homalodisca vitripennis]